MSISSMGLASARRARPDFFFSRRRGRGALTSTFSSSTSLRRREPPVVDVDCFPVAGADPFPDLDLDLAFPVVDDDAGPDGAEEDDEDVEGVVASVPEELSLGLLLLEVSLGEGSSVFMSPRPEMSLESSILPLRSLTGSEPPAEEEEVEEETVVGAAGGVPLEVPNETVVDDVADAVADPGL